jgi:glucose-6-phosphate isomerase
VIRTLASTENPLFFQARMSAAAASSRRVSLNQRITRRRTRSVSAARSAGVIGRLFAADQLRAERLSFEACGLFVDHSKQRITTDTLPLLLRLAEACGLRERIDAMYAGRRINTTENRAVLHVALRAPRSERILLDGADVVPGVHDVLGRMASFCESLRAGRWLGHTGKRIRAVVNIGIGGSDLGPVMAYTALRHYSDRDLTFRFLSNVDGTDFAEAVQGLDPTETLFIVASKTFTTEETLANARTART